MWSETKLQSYNVAVWTKEVSHSTPYFHAVQAIIIPLYEGLCDAAHSFMLYIADTVLQPIVDSFVRAAKDAYVMLYTQVRAAFNFGVE